MVKVMINGKKRSDPRQVLSCRVVRRNTKTIIVELPDGNYIKRKIRRDLVIA